MNFRFDLKSLQLFVSVVEFQSLTKAAEHENIAASAVSKRISDLEIALNSTLLHRQARGVEPTAAGLALLHHARTVLSSIEQLIVELGDYANGSKGHVRIAANRSSIIQGLADDIRDFIDAHPDINVALEEDTSPNILKKVAEGHADLGVFTFGYADTFGLNTFDYYNDHLIVLVPQSHPLVEKTSVQFSEILKYDVVNLQSLTAWNNLLNLNAERVGATLRLRYRVSSFDILCAVVAAGLGIAVAPNNVLKTIPDPRLKGVPLDEEWAHRKHMICVRNTEGLLGPSRMMLDHLRLKSSI